MNALTHDALKALLSYDPDTGIFYWRARAIGTFQSFRACRTWNSRFSGKPAGSVDALGYIQIRITPYKYFAHRLAWLYMTGEWPPEQIDHKNRNPSDNRWSNLRCATPAQNTANTSKHSDNKSGVKGVHWSSQTNKWHAKIRRDGKSLHLGFFCNIDDAAAAYAKAARDLHGEFARVYYPLTQPAALTKAGSEPTELA